MPISSRSICELATVHPLFSSFKLIRYCHRHLVGSFSKPVHYYRTTFMDLHRDLYTTLVGVFTVFLSTCVAHTARSTTSLFTGISMTNTIWGNTPMFIHVSVFDRYDWSVLFLDKHSWEPTIHQGYTIENGLVNLEVDTWIPSRETFVDVSVLAASCTLSHAPGWLGPHSKEQN